MGATFGGLIGFFILLLVRAFSPHPENPEIRRAANLKKKQDEQRYIDFLNS
jgi:hypothetical protein